MALEAVLGKDAPHIGRRGCDGGSADEGESEREVQ
jgi:hypothetical protein